MYIKEILYKNRDKVITEELIESIIIELYKSENRRLVFSSKKEDYEKEEKENYS